eukprot:gene12944-biopygen1400
MLESPVMSERRPAFIELLPPPQRLIVAPGRRAPDRVPSKGRGRLTEGRGRLSPAKDAGDCPQQRTRETVPSKGRGRLTEAASNGACSLRGRGLPSSDCDASRPPMPR